MKLFWKLFCSMVSITVLTCSVGGFVLIDGQFRTAFEQEVQSLFEENDMLRFTLSREMDHRSLWQWEDLSRLAEDVVLSAGGRTIAFRLSGADGTALGGSGFLEVDARPLVAMFAGNQRGWTLEEVPGRRILHGASTLTLFGETVYLENCRDVTALFTRRRTQYQTFSGMMLVMIAGVAALSLLVAHLILRPLQRLSSAARRMAAGELTQRVPVTGEDELGQLSEDFNSMAERLEEQVNQLTDAARREQDFTASFAHELKTPLTSIIGYADLLLSRVCSPEQVRDHAGYIFREGRRLEALSHRLMELIVLDRQEIQLRAVPLGAFLKQAGNALRPALEQAGIRLEIDAEDVPALLEPVLMETAVLNLLDNARKATPSGGRVTVTGRAEEDGCVSIRVSDTGKGIPPDELPRVTEPFYMADKSRSRAQGGAGLGLALCQRIVVLHGGTMVLENNPGRGVTVTVRLKGGDTL